MEIKFKYPTHQCTATISGDWIVYLCPHCDGWQLKQNWKTGQIVIRERSYEALLFGQNVEQEAELFAFWHSSQRNDPGLNIAMYANARVDELLEKIHKTDEKDDRQDIYEKIDTLIQDDIPAIFLYSPSFIYVSNSKGSPTGISLSHLITPKDRLQNINTWFINTERVWKWFAHQPHN
jgi:peptide/nickel transport system substrate-binding protein